MRCCQLSHHRICVVLLEIAALTALAFLFYNSYYATAVSQKFTKAKPTRAELRSRQIPRILHQTYSTSLVPVVYHTFISNCQRLNPDWQYFLWRDLDIDTFIKDHFPQYMKKYKGFVENIQRSDMARYMILHHYGGIYLDMDVECLMPFSPSLESAGPAFLDQERREQTQILYGRELTAMNSAMGAAPGHPFFLAMLAAVNSVPPHVKGPLGTTGPSLLTLVYKDWLRFGNQSGHPVRLLEPEVFSPMMSNFRKKCQRIVPDRPETVDHNIWFAKACQSVLSDKWRPDSTTPNVTVGRHHFLHLGYFWGPRPAAKIDIAANFSNVKMYHVNRMRTEF